LEVAGMKKGLELEEKLNAHTNATGFGKIKQ
jgi:hypothetical protein